MTVEPGCLELPDVTAGLLLGVDPGQLGVAVVETASECLDEGRAEAVVSELATADILMSASSSSFSSRCQYRVRSRIRSRRSRV